MKSKITRWIKPVAIIALAGVLVAVLALALPGVVSAAGLMQEPQPELKPVAPDPERLERLYERVQAALERQGDRLGRTDEVVARAQERIETLMEDGKDTSALEAALANFEDQVQAAKNAHETAAAILDTHAGFDASGKVTDSETAKMTLQEASRSMRAASRDLRPALRELLRATRQFWRDNH